MALLFSRVSQYRSSVYEIARGLLRSRNRLALKIQELVLQNRQLQTRIERLTKESQADKDRIDQIGHELERQRMPNS